MVPPLPSVDMWNIVLGWENIHYVQYRSEQFSDSHDAVRAKWEQLDRPRSRQQTAEAQSGHSVKVQLNSDQD